MGLLSLALSTIAVSILLTWILRCYAIHQNIVDIPGARSSHSTPTPRGGGVAIVLSLLLALAVLAFTGFLAWSVAWAISGAGAGIAILGFFDDHKHVAVRWRLLGHFAGSVWALFWLGGLPPLELFGFVLDLGWGGHMLTALYLVWMEIEAQRLDQVQFGAGHRGQPDGVSGVAGDFGREEKNAEHGPHPMPRSSRAAQ